MSSRAISALVFALVAGCSLSGVDRIELPLCRSDNDCAALDVTLEDPACERHACDVSTGQCVVAPTDEDGDGDAPVSCGGGDCDDTDPARHSRATEICNGIDDDCDGLLDGPDEDDDGDEASDLCAGPAVASDCDDTDPYTYYRAPEYCDGIDDDCILDGVTRQSGGRRFEPSEDRDGDGHAALDASCLPGPEGDDRFYPLDDCDDTREDVYPGAWERCDGIDNDCDGVPDDVAGSSTPGGACRSRALLAGGLTTCSITREDEVVCWGASDNGQLGVLSSPTGMAVAPPALQALEGIALSNGGGCGIAPDRTVTCWGAPWLVSETPVYVHTGVAPNTVIGTHDAVEVAASGIHACLRDSAGDVWCWGDNCGEALRVTGTAPCGAASLPPTRVDVTDVVQIGVGRLMSCARRANGEVWCWGGNPVGVLASGLTTTTPAPVLGIDDAEQLAVGDQFACALRASGEVQCWGRNDAGWCEGCEGVVSSPHTIPTDGTVVELRAASRHACVRYDDGRFGCWGDNTYGQLAARRRDLPNSGSAITSPITGALALGLGDRHTCVRTAEMTWCAGQGIALGSGAGAYSPDELRGDVGVRVSIDAHVMQIAMSDDLSCFRLPDLSVECAGRRPYTGEIDYTRDDGLPELSLEGVVSVALGVNRSLAIFEDGRALARGEAIYAATPTSLDAEGRIAGVSDAIQGSCGHDHCCFVRRDGSAWCAGIHSRGQLGNRSPTTLCGTGRRLCSADYLRVEGLDHVSAIEAGGDHTCAIHDGGEVSCWGDNTAGQGGGRPLGVLPLATRVEGLPAGDPAVGLALGVTRTCAILASGDAWCWGEAFDGVASHFSIDPQRIASNVVGIASTDDSVCLLQRSGMVRCVGANDRGQLGDGTTDASAVLVNVSGITEGRVLGCGGRSCCVTQRTGQTLCWGDNGARQLANGDDVPRSTPTPVAHLRSRLPG